MGFNKLITSLTLTTLLLGTNGLVSQNTRYIDRVTQSGLKYQEVEQSATSLSSDDREYTELILANKLQVVLVSDKKADTAAARLSVSVGSLSDPKPLPGLAHLCEHMLFVGSAKFPNSWDYKKFIDSHSGTSNAKTGYDTTRYYFKVNSGGLDGALDRFSQFFTSPSFNSAMVDSEVNIVDSEFKEDNQDIFWRKLILEKHLTNPDHPYARDNVGNREILYTLPKEKGINIVDELRTFFNRYYLSSMMKLVVVSNHPIDELKSSVIEKFSNVKNRLGAVPPTDNGSPLREQDKALDINMATTDTTRLISLQFFTPALRIEAANDPTFILSELLNSGAPGSLKSLLMGKQWIYYIKASVKESYATFAVYQIEFSATTKGLEHTEDILDLLFDQINLLRSRGITKDTFKELQSLKLIKSKFGSRKDPSQVAEMVLNGLVSGVPLDRLVELSDYPSHFNASSITRFMKNIEPENMRVTIVSPDNVNRPNLLTEPSFKTKYTVTPVSKKLLSKLRVTLNAKECCKASGLELPRKNPWVATNFDIIQPSSTSDVPKLIFKDQSRALWYSFMSYDQPKADVRLIFRNKRINASPKAYVMGQMIASMIIGDLSQETAQAAEAGLQVQIDVGSGTINLAVNGFSHHLPKFAELVVNAAKELKVTPSNFKTALQAQKNTITGHENWHINKQIYMWNNIIMMENSWSYSKLESALDDITIDDMTKFKVEVFGFSFIEATVFGNLDQAKAMNVMVYAQQTLTNAGKAEPKPQPTRYVALPEGQDWVYEVDFTSQDKTNSYINFYLELTENPNDLTGLAHTAILASIIKSPVSNQLRSVEQLGYTVYGEEAKIGAGSGIQIFIDSNYQPNFLEQRIEAFLADFVKNTVNRLTESLFHDHVAAAITDKEISLKFKSTIVSSHNSQILKQDPNFTAAQDLLLTLKKVTLSAFKEHINQYVPKNSPSRRKLSLHFVAPKVQEEYQASISNPKTKPGTFIKDINAWKLRHYATKCQS